MTCFFISRKAPYCFYTIKPIILTRHTTALFRLINYNICIYGYIILKQHTAMQLYY